MHVPSSPAAMLGRGAQDSDEGLPRLFEAFGQALDDALIVLDGTGTCITYNQAAWHLFCEGDGLFMCAGNRLAAKSVGDAAALKKKLEEALASAVTGTAGELSYLSVKRLGRLPLTVTIMRARPEVELAWILLLVTDPEADIRQSVAVVCQLYGLTPAECRLAWHLVDGWSLAEAARALKLKLPTVRAYLKQIFAKLGVNRQSSLIKLMLMSRPLLAKGLSGS